MASAGNGSGVQLDLGIRGQVDAPTVCWVNLKHLRQRAGPEDSQQQQPKGLERKTNTVMSPAALCFPVCNQAGEFHTDVTGLGASWEEPQVAEGRLEETRPHLVWLCLRGPRKMTQKEWSENRSQLLRRPFQDTLAQEP
jgi:hypothetical protein